MEQRGRGKGKGGKSGTGAGGESEEEEGALFSVSRGGRLTEGGCSWFGGGGGGGGGTSFAWMGRTELSEGMQDEQDQPPHKRVRRDTGASDEEEEEDDLEDDGPPAFLGEFLSMRSTAGGS